MSDAPVTRAEFEELKAQIAELKALLKGADVEEGIPDDHMVAISAALAAYLGKRATIKFVRRKFTPGDSWRSQGRVSVAGSHRLEKTRGW
ncbi:MAG: hypothetical protein MH204_08150 [Fimbriimonadaceae bacterium]|nr:hypothetical protein [Fimbriimonadaceae bacterium]